MSNENISNESNSSLEKQTASSQQQTVSSQQQSAQILETAVEKTLPPKRKFYQKKRYWILVALTVLIWYTQCPNPCPISEQTHFITEPRTIDGRNIDYFQAFSNTYADLLDRPEENGYRMILSVLGPRALEQNLLANDYTWEQLPTSEKGQDWFNKTWKPLCEKLKLDPNRKPDFYDSYSMEEYIQIHGITGTEPIQEDRPLVRGQKTRLAVQAGDEDVDKISDYVSRLQSGEPWNEAENPQAFQWLKESNSLLDVYMEASKKPFWISYYAVPEPIDDMLDSSGNYVSCPPCLIGILLPDIQGYRKSARALSVRIGWNLSRAKMASTSEDPTEVAKAAADQAAAVDQAIDDILAQYRIGRKVPEICLVTRLVGFAVENMASQNVAHLLATEAATDEQLARLATGISSLKPIKTWKKTWFAERLMIEQFVVSACEYPKIFEAYQINSYDDKSVFSLLYLTIDKRRMLLALRQYLEPYNKMFSDISFSERENLLKETDTQQKKASSFIGFLRILLTIQSRSKWFADILCTKLLPAYKVCFNAQYSAEAKQSLSQTGIALERYRLKTGAYPSSLEKLVPEFLPSAPRDAFTESSPLIYRLQDDGSYLLYSVGRNRQDDRGVENPQDADEGDLVFSLKKRTDN